MPATCFTKASSTAKNDSMAAEDMAIIGTQIEESFAQTSEEAEICLKRLTSKRRGQLLESCELWSEIKPREAFSVYLGTGKEI